MRLVEGWRPAGPTMPAAVTVATVAEPVASRIPTAISQPSSSTEIPEPLARSPITPATPESESTCLNPPPAATISMIEATPGRPEPREALTWPRFMPEVWPTATIATSTPTNSAKDGSPTKSSTLRVLVPSIEDDLADGADQHQHHRQHDAR